VNAEQLALEDYARKLGERGRDTGMAAAKAAEDPEWVALVEAYLWSLLPGDVTDADEIRTLFGPSLAVGSILSHAQKAGWIRCVGFAVSTAPSRHGGLIRRWERR
jgi:hypothetical protein